MATSLVSSGLQRLADLWWGRVQPATAFWTYGIFYGTLLNVATSVGTLVLLIQGAPTALTLAVHFLPLPYNMLAVVGVLRNPLSSRMARTMILVWAVAVTVV